MSLLTGFDSFNIVIVNCRKRETGGIPPAMRPTRSSILKS